MLRKRLHCEQRVGNFKLPGSWHLGVWWSFSQYQAFEGIIDLPSYSEPRREGLGEAGEKHFLSKGKSAHFCTGEDRILHR